MTKIVLDLTALGMGSASLPYNGNFRKIEEEFQEKVLYRDNPLGEPNEMKNSLDMNGNRIYNLAAPVGPTDPVRVMDLGGSNPTEVIDEVVGGSGISVNNADPKKPIINNTSPNVNADWQASGGPSMVLNKPTFGSAAFSDNSDFASSEQGELADSALQDVTSGIGIVVDKTDPKNPIIIATGGGGGGGGAVDEVVAGSGISVSSIDPEKPVVTNTSPNVNGDWDASSGPSQILNKPVLGTAALANVGTTSGTVAAGNDSRITGAAQKINNLSDIADAAAARVNLGLTSVASMAVTEVRQIPQTTATGAYSVQLSDSGKHIYKPAASVGTTVWTIPANASLPFPVGTAVTFVNLGGNVSLSVTSDTLVRSPSGATGPVTLTKNGVVTVLKVAPTIWVISGSGIE